MMSVGGKEIVFQMKLKLKLLIEGNRLKKDTKKENFEKDVMHFIETNHQINMTFEHSVLNHQIGMTFEYSVVSNSSFKKHLNAKNFKMFWKYWSSLGKARCCCVSACCKGDVNVHEKCELRFRRKLKRTLIINSINRKANWWWVIVIKKLLMHIKLCQQ